MSSPGASQVFTFMIGPLKLLLPALIPSWNFFDVIGDSPRIEYTLLQSPDETPNDWLEFRPRPSRVPFSAMLVRLVWNAWWNETMFVVSCAERLLAEPTEHSENEIIRRIATDLTDHLDWKGGWLSFRIALLSAHEDTITREIAFISAPRHIAINAAPRVSNP